MSLPSGLCVLDSNVLISYTNLDLPASARQFVAERAIRRSLIISSITVVEAEGYHAIGNAVETVITSLIEQMTIVPIDDTVIKTAVMLKRHMRSLKAADAIIAATAYMFELPLLSADKHMHRLAAVTPDLVVIDPWE